VEPAAEFGSEVAVVAAQRLADESVEDDLDPASARPWLGRSTATAALARPASTRSTGRQASAESLNPCSNSSGGPLPATRSTRVR
jgi:hypothetical protein